MADRILNGAIFLVTLVLTIRIFRENGKWNPERGKHAFRYFTVLSNVFCAVSALLMVILPGAEGAWALKYMGTAAVTVTMLTVFLFLAPSIGKDWVKVLMSGGDMFMHLITPLMALISFCVFERRGLSFPRALLGMIPVVLYGPWYLYKICYAPAEKRWEDFYGFNKGGKWPVSFVRMVAGTFLICMGLMALQNL